MEPMNGVILLLSFTESAQAMTGGGSYLDHEELSSNKFQVRLKPVSVVSPLYQDETSLRCHDYPTVGVDNKGSCTVVQRYSWGLAVKGNGKDLALLKPMRIFSVRVGATFLAQYLVAFL